MKRAVVIEPDGSVRPLIISDFLDTGIRQLQDAVGGTFQIIPHNQPNLSAFCDEDGKQKEKEPNMLASFIFGQLLDPTDLIVGTVVVMGPVGPNGDTLGLTPEQADIFLSPSGEEIINQLASR